MLHPVKASAIVNELYITAGKNHLYAAQGRASANDVASETRSLFAADAALADEYNHKLAHGKWDHMMDQTHLGYTFWNEPPLNVMPAVNEVQPASGPKMAVAAEGQYFARTGGDGFMALPAFDAYNRQTQFIDVFNRGTGSFAYAASADKPWIKLSQTQGTVSKDGRLLVSIDWEKVAEGTNGGIISIAQKGGCDFPRARGGVASV